MSMPSFKSSIGTTKSSVGTSAKSSVGTSAARLRSGTACAVLELAGVVLELASPVSSASVGSEGAHFLVGCASCIGSPVSGFTCSDKIFEEGHVISASF